MHENPAPWSEVNGPALPSLFVSHGAPLLAVAPGRAGNCLAALGAQLPRPAAIVVVSAHWETRRPAVTAVAQPVTIHDFHGFPAALYELRYPAPGAPGLAARVAQALETAGLETDLDPVRGLDHGAWVPLLLMFPNADVPVLQVSVQPGATPEHHWAVGRALAPLCRQGVLVMGSGSITHNLGDAHPEAEDTGEAAYSREFREWIAGAVAAGDTARVLRWAREAPHARRAHPTDEHFVPLLVAMAAGADGARHERLHAGVTFGVVGMDHYLFGAEHLQGNSLGMQQKET